MPCRRHGWSALAAVILTAAPYVVTAQDAAPNTPTSIVPFGSQPRGIYSTHPQPQDSTAPLPWQKAPAPSPTTSVPGSYQPRLPPPGQIPFGREAPNVSQPLPTGPRTTEAMPVQDVDSVEVSTPAPAEAPTDVANPAAENPAVPKEETSPIFAADSKFLPPKKVIVRALNKVTGQSSLLEIKPGETAAFGNLDITAVTCQASLPDSQVDYAGLLELNEHVPGQVQPKLRFRGWMYATSPSVTSLEHPIYDVTMVKCDTGAPKPEPKKEEKPSKKKAK